ncbi:MAG TPA: hypothetical protein VHK64_02690, partial [Nocardioidaceae bacterium]|nr:hypothetical protein [Nocardioidaceae bacterium]
MALQTQHLEVAFNSGADESQEDYVTSSPLSVLTDFEYRKDAGLRKRYGWQPKGDLDVGLGVASLVSNGSQLGVLGRNTLTGVGASGIDADGSPRVQHTARITSERFANLVDSADLQDADTAYCTDGRVCVVATRYDGSAYSVVIAVFDTAGALLHRETVTAARRARVVAQGASRFNVYYTSTSSNVINVRSIIGDPTQGGTQSSTLSLVSNHATYKAYDVVAGAGSNAYLAYNEVTTGHLRVALISAACAVSANFDTAITACDYPSIAYHPTTTHVHLAYANRGSTGGYALTLNSTPSSILHGPTAVVAGTTVIRTAIAPLLDATDSPFLALFQDLTGLTRNVYAVSVTDTHGATATTPHYQVDLATAPFGLACGQFDTAAGSDRPYVGLRSATIGTAAAAAVIPTCLLGMLSVGGYGTSLGGGTGLTYSPRSFGPVVPLVTDAAAFLVSDATCSRIPAGSGSVRYTAVPYIFDESDGTEHLAVLVVRLNTSPSPEPAVTFGRSTYVAGGALRFFDGQRLGELTPPWIPDYVVPATAGAGLNPAAGTYAYVAYAEWVDGNGEVHRGPVSGTT